ncbi:MAG: L,D-transpeptidase [Leptolyngbyaceae cyanobacterium bins.59]|nr:L,D-transpeptidase [Leptolyngbyaceae cyanobacterium bins.59]
MASSHNESLSQSMMILCLGTAFLLIASQWRNPASLQEQAQEQAQGEESTSQAISQPVSQPFPPGMETSSSEKPSSTENAPLGRDDRPSGSVLPLRENIASPPPASQPSTPSSHLMVDLSDRRVYLYQNNQVRGSYPLGIGQTGWETPTGTFKVIQMRRNPSWKHPITGAVVPSGPQNPLGTRWIGFWSDGHSLVGFHGTNQESSIGRAVSHGCLRMRNRDIVALYDQVSEGTPVTVRP